MSLDGFPDLELQRDGHSFTAVFKEPRAVHLSSGDLTLDGRYRVTLDGREVVGSLDPQDDDSWRWFSQAEDGKRTSGRKLLPSAYAALESLVGCATIKRLLTDTPDLYRCDRCGTEKLTRLGFPDFWSHGYWLADQHRTELLCIGCVDRGNVHVGSEQPIRMIDDLQTLDDVRQFIQDQYIASTRGWAVPEAGPLMERAVALAGEAGLTLQQLRGVFGRFGQERFDRALATMRAAGQITESSEVLPNRAGRPQEQVVFYASRYETKIMDATP